VAPSLELIQIATKDKVYIFLTQVENKKQLKEGLIEIFENSEIEKIGLNVKNDIKEISSYLDTASFVA
jgi:hypothetical protein